ncbi:uncharacterized protein C2845_PM14G03200 [Panicum miliaceum]|uniref:Uncharacterized protein n=1 Tax=Panicum miliaceum TaxID=4540 RepID=A0A3L6PUV6_PANMI|nr:uncharacterized protein C2845_PM14G03200 [Panicum miliaceum]
MLSSSFAGAISSGASSTLSPNAAPYTLLARQGRAPPGRLQDGDASRLIDDNSCVEWRGQQCILGVVDNPLWDEAE